MDIQRHQASERGLEFKVDYTNITDPMIICDEQRIKQVLLGLQSNAIKFTQKGYVKIIASIHEEGGKKFLQVTIEDTGVGIAYEDQDKLFKLFGFLQDSKQLNTRGIGLGLVISDQIVTKFNGRIIFESVPKQGSKFTFSFQLEKSTNGQKQNEDGKSKFQLDAHEFYNEWVPDKKINVEFDGLEDIIPILTLDPEENQEVDLSQIDNTIENMLQFDPVNNIANQDQPNTNKDIRPVSADSDKTLKYNETEPNEGLG